MKRIGCCAPAANSWCTPRPTAGITVGAIRPSGSRNGCAAVSCRPTRSNGFRYHSLMHVNEQSPRSLRRRQCVARAFGVRVSVDASRTEWERMGKGAVLLGSGNPIAPDQVGDLWRHLRNRAQRLIGGFLPESAGCRGTAARCRCHLSLHLRLLAFRMAQDWDTLGPTFRQARYDYLVLSCGLLFIALGIAAGRWFVTLRLLGGQDRLVGKPARLVSLAGRTLYPWQHLAVRGADVLGGGNRAVRQDGEQPGARVNLPGVK